MIIKQTKFIKSSTSLKQCPSGNMPEFAFIGRSNVGKSSIINMLTSNHKLAKISSTPGKTQTINHFSINNEWYVVDLPGYGYAKVSKSMRSQFEGFIKEYIIKSKNLRCLFVLVDSRHEPQTIDLEFMQWLGEEGVPFVVVLTKTDKMKPGGLTRNIELYHATLLETWEELPQFFYTSSEKKIGKEEILNFIENVLQA